MIEYVSQVLERTVSKKSGFAGRTDSETNLRVEASVLETEREGKKSSSQV